MNQMGGQRLSKLMSVLAVWLSGWARRSPIAAAVDDLRAQQELSSWKRNTPSMGPVPALVKRALLRTVAAEHRLSTLVETGTCLGKTTYALRDDFVRII